MSKNRTHKNKITLNCKITTYIKGTNILQLPIEAEEITTNHWAFITPDVESSGEYLVSLFDPF